MTTETSDSPTRLTAIIAAYAWERGRTCYRCARDDVETATVAALHQEGRTLPVPACPSCVIVLEREREREARRFGWPYRPGSTVDCPDR
jgi:hypothetical protein